MKQKLLLFLSVFLLSVICFSNLISAAEMPQLPMIVAGNVSINDKPAKIGTEVSARLNNEEVETIKITEKGKFTILLQKLNESEEIKIYVDGIYSEQSVNYESGDFQQLTLKVEKSYVFYYALGGIIALAIILIIWKSKKIKN